MSFVQTLLTGLLAAIVVRWVYECLLAVWRFYRDVRLRLACNGMTNFVVQIFRI